MRAAVIAAGVIVAAGLEVLAAGTGARGQLAHALLLHAASSAVVAASLHSGLLDGKGAWSFALLLACAFFVPGLGAIGLVAVAVAVPRRPGDGSREREPFVRTQLPLPPDDAGGEWTAATGEGRDLTGDRGARVAALIALKHRHDPSTVALLWRALKDPEEEVRLLAFSFLESRANAVNRRIQVLTQELETASEDRCGVLHARLAFEHWELAWQGLVQGEILGHELARASEHADEALKRDPDSAPVQLLRARVLLRRGMLAEAEVALHFARARGIPGAALGPYLAELAFRGRRFDEVRRHLADPALATGNSATVRLQRYWCST